MPSVPISDEELAPQTPVTGGHVRSTLLRSSAAIFLIRAMPVLATSIIGIVFPRLISTALNGIYVQFWVRLAFLLGFACIGLPALLLTHPVRNIHRWLGRLRARHVGLYIVWVVALGSIYAAMGWDRQVFPVWLLLAVFIVHTALILAEAYLVVMKRFTATFRASGLYTIAFLGLHAAFLRGGLSFEALFRSLLSLALARLLYLAIYSCRVYRTARRGVQPGRMPRVVRAQWGQLGLYEVIQVVFRWLDKIIVSFVVSPALFAVYTVGTIDIPFMGMLISAAGSGLLMQMSAGATDTERRLALVRYSGAALARIVYPVFFFLFLFRYELFATVFGSKYAASVPLFAISLLILPLRAYNFTAILQHTGNVRIINIGAGIDLCVALVLVYPLYYYFGLRGVAFSFMISTYVQVAYYLHHTARLLGCRVADLIPLKTWVMLLIVFSSLDIALHYTLVHYCSPRQTLILGFLGSVVIILIAVAPLFFSKKAHG